MKKLKKDTKIKFNSDSKFSKMKDSKIISMLNEYYSDDISVKGLILKYKLDVEVYDFSKNIPYIESDFECPYDDTMMYIKLPSKTMASSWKDNFICFECGHEKFDKEYRSTECYCDNCQNEREKIVQQKRDIIISQIDSTPIDYHDIDFDLRFRLAIILQVLNVKSLTNINPLSIHDFEEKIYNGMISNLKELYHHGIIDISKLSRLDAFSDFDFENKTFTFYMSQVKWDVYVKYPSVENNDLLELLKHPTPEILDKELINKYYRQVIINELENVYVNELEEFKFVYKSGSDRVKLEEAFIRLLNIYSPAQIYSLIWAAVRRADNLRTINKWGNFKSRQSAFVLNCIENRIQRLVEREEDVKPYSYPNIKCDQLTSTKIFFGEIHPTIDWFNKLIPSDGVDIQSNEIKMEYLEAHEQMLNREKDSIDLIDGILKYAQDYRVTKYGIVVNDGNIDILYSYEISCYRYGKDFGENIDFKSEEWFFDLETSIYIDGYYSAYFIIMLLKKLESSNILRIEE